MENDQNSENSNSSLLEANLMKENLLANIEALSKKSGVRSGLLIFAIGLPCSILCFLGSYYLRNTNVDSSQISRDLAPVAGPFSFLAPLAPDIAIFLGVILLFFALYSGYKTLIIKASSTITVKCPECSKDYEFSKVYRKSFAFVCPDCLSLVRAKASEYNHKFYCDYCDYTFYNGVTKKFECPSCRYKQESGEMECPKCGAKISKGVLFCNSCYHWLAAKESNTQKLTATAVIYDVSLFSGKTCKAYVNDMIPRICNWSDQFAEIMQKIKNVKNLSLYGTGGIVTDLNGLFHLVSKCTLAIEMLNLKKIKSEDEEMFRYKDKINQLSITLERIKSSGHLFKKDDKNLSQIITQAQNVIVKKTENT